MTSAQLNKRLIAITQVSLKGKKVKNLYRLMCQPYLYIEAYRKIYANKGAITKGIDDNTLDGTSMKRIFGIIERLKNGVFQPKAVRRLYIPKKQGKKRPLGIPRGDEKLVQEVMRMLLENIYEPIFSDRSHGFRPGKSCHTALTTIRKQWNGVKWLVDFDIKGCFDNINHTILLEILEKRIEDKKFIRLIKAMLQAGYMEGWKYNRTYSGTPQGGIVSPILANIYLHELDEYIEKKIVMFNKGKERIKNPLFVKLTNAINRKRGKIRNSSPNGDMEQLRREIEELDKKRKKIPWGIPIDPNYKRLRYVRYADDFILGVTGSKADAMEIMDEINSFIREKLDLETSAEKTGIRYAKDGTGFLGYDVKTHTAHGKTRKGNRNGTHFTRRSITDIMQLHIPKDKITQFCKNHDYGILDTNIGDYRSYLINKSDAEVFSTYNAELRGFANYYNLAYACKSRLSRMFYVAQRSLVSTLADKHKTSKRKIYSRFKKGTDLICTYGKKDKQKKITLFKAKYINVQNVYNNHMVDFTPNTFTSASKGKELIQRLFAGKCEYCNESESTGGYEVHQIRKLSDIAHGKAMWQKLMTYKKRKTLILCTVCHDLLTKGVLPDMRYKGYA